MPRPTIPTLQRGAVKRQSPGMTRVRTALRNLFDTARPEADGRVHRSDMLSLFVIKIHARAEPCLPLPQSPAHSRREMSFPDAEIPEPGN